MSDVAAAVHDGVMARSLRFADAVRLLGGEENKFVSALDKSAGWLMAVTAVPFDVVLGWFDLKADVARLSQEAVRYFYERRSGLARYGRADRIEAAHTVIVIAAFFEHLSAVPLPITLKKAEAVALGAGAPAMPGEFVEQIMSAARFVPGVGMSLDDFRGGLHDYYRQLGEKVNVFLGGLAATARLSAGDRAAITAALGEVADGALARYDDSFLELVKAFPEVAYWAHRQDDRAARAALADLTTAFRAFWSGQAPDDRRAGLAAKHLADLRTPVTDVGELPPGLKVPTLDELYLPARFRVMLEPTQEQVSDEDEWAQRDVRDDLRDFVIGHLTSPVATRAPLYVVGAEGAGKSALSRTLSARLPAADFLVLHVLLREMPDKEKVQDQIEEAIRTAIGETVSWPALVASAGDAVPVVIFDSFDEFLQATGANQADYLDRIAWFQNREATQQRPVAAMVLSRTAAAGQAKIPEDTVAVRLENFDDDQISAWLAGWNRTNSTTPLTADSLAADRAMAAQPLLLAVLAARATGPHRTRDLHDHVLDVLSAREVHKYGPGTRRPYLMVETDRETLAAAAFASFRRGRRGVTEDELDEDLAGPDEAERTPVNALRPPLRPGELALTRFPFRRHGDTYTFSHPALADHLVAHSVWQVLSESARGQAGSPFFRKSAPRDDGLRELLADQAISHRGPLLELLSAMATEQDAGGTARPLLLRLFRTAHDTPELPDPPAVRPPTPGAPARYATYRANLLLLLVCATGPVRASELFDDRTDVVSAWRDQALLWESQLPLESRLSLVQALTVERVREDGVPDVLISWDRGGPSPGATEPAWTFPASAALNEDEFRRRCDFRCDPADDMIRVVRDLGTGLIADYERYLSSVVDGSATFVDLFLGQLCAAGHLMPADVAGLLRRLAEALHPVSPRHRTRMVMCALAHLDHGDDQPLAGLLHTLLTHDLASVDAVAGAHALVRLAELGLPVPTVRQLEFRDEFDALLGEVAVGRPDLARRLAPLGPDALRTDGEAE